MLQPNDPDSYFKDRELVPGDMLGELDRAKIVITNYHAFKLRERVDLSKADVPRCPEHPDERARKEWRRLVPVLQRMGVLTEADGLALANLCQTYSTLIRAQEKLNESGILYQTPSGYVMQNPLLSVVNQCVDTITKLSREFGLTPAARTRIVAQVDYDGEDWLERARCMPL